MDNKTLIKLTASAMRFCPTAASCWKILRTSSLINSRGKGRRGVRKSWPCFWPYQFQLQFTLISVTTVKGTIFTLYHLV